jgi:hypothetical protein
VYFWLAITIKESKNECPLSFEIGKEKLKGILLTNEKKSSRY